MRLLLYQRLLVPDEHVPPHTGPRIWCSINDRPIDAVRFATPELILQDPLRIRVLGKHHEAGGVLVDTVHREWPAPAVGSLAIFDLSEHGRSIRPALQRHTQDSGRLVDDDERLVVIDDIEF